MRGIIEESNETIKRLFLFATSCEWVEHVAGQQVFKLTGSFLEFYRDERGQPSATKDVPG